MSARGSGYKPFIKKGRDMLDMIKNPVMTMFDSDFLAYAGSSIMSKTLVIFIGIWLTCRFIDIATDREARPSAKHILIRGLIAFFVPFGFILTTEYAQTMPSSYRLYGAGSYDIGKALPAGTYSLFSGGGEASVTLSGEGGDDISQKWSGGTMTVTVYDGDTMTLEGCSARNRTASLVYNANAKTMAVANGSSSLVAGADIRPGTYEITSLGDDSAYEIRDDYLQVGYPLSEEPFEGVVYADVHYGEVLYVRDASVVLYSNVFAGARATGDETEVEDVADASDKQDEAEEDGKTGVEADKDAKKDEASKEDEETKKDDKADEGDSKNGKGDNKETGEKAGDTSEKEATDESDKTGSASEKAKQSEKSVEELIAKVSQVPWTRSAYVPQDSVPDGTVDGEDDLEALDSEKTGQTVHDMIQRTSVATKAVA